MVTVSVVVLPVVMVDTILDGFGVGVIGLVVVPVLTVVVTDSVPISVVIVDVSLVVSTDPSV